jgi:carbon monoxide dehydrogenase subunit G
MKLEHEFRVPVPITQAWDVLLDVERIAPCMPGATVESFDGETVHGRVKVKVGPIQVTYGGSMKFVDKDDTTHRVTMEASGKEARGSGTAAATIHAVMIEEGGETVVNVITDLAITGKPAQFGRGVMVEVGNKLIGRFADCLAAEIGMGGAGSSAAAASDEATVAASGDAAAAAGGGGETVAAAGGETAAAAGGETVAAAGVAAQAEAAGVDVLAAEAGAVAVDDGGGASGALGGGGASGALGGGGADGDGVGAAGAVTAGDAAAGVPGPSNGAGTTPAPQLRPVASPTPSRPAHRLPENEAIDLLDVGGAAILKRVGPLVAGLVVLFVIFRLIRRR